MLRVEAAHHAITDTRLGKIGDLGDARGEALPQARNLGRHGRRADAQTDDHEGGARDDARGIDGRRGRAHSVLLL